MSPETLAEYRELFAQRRELMQVYYQRLLGGVQSATLATAGNSQSYTAMSVGELRAQIDALTRRLRQIASLPAGDIRSTYPDFVR